MVLVGHTLSKCRHEAIAKYFGDENPDCSKNCDHCRNPSALKKQMDLLHQLQNRTRTCIAPAGPSLGPFGFNTEQYEGGRKTYGFHSYDDDDDDDEGSSEELSAQQRKNEWNSFFQKQMSLRRGTEEQPEEFTPADLSCPLRDANSRKISKLTVKAREHCLKMLEEALNSNMQSASEESSDPHVSAVEMEYQAFKGSKTANLYKASVLKKVGEINKASKDGSVYSAFGPCAAAVPANDEEKQDEKTAYDDFLPASQVYSFKHKRVGLKISKCTDVFQSASDLLKTSVGSDGSSSASKEDEEEEMELDCKAWCSDESSSSPNKNNGRDEAGLSTNKLKEAPKTSKQKVSSLLGSPSKKVKPNKKQIELAEAAKNESQNITKFFAKSTKEKNLSEDTEEGEILNNAVELSSCNKLQEDSCLFETKPDALEVIPVQEKQWSYEDEVIEEETVSVKEKVSKDSRTKAFRKGGLQVKTSSIEQKSSIKSGTSGVTIDHTDVQTQELSAFGKRAAEEEDHENLAKKKHCTAAEYSTLGHSERSSSNLAKRERSCNAAMSAANKEGTKELLSPASRAAFLKEAADIVVKSLTPFYKDNKFASRDLFKSFARYLSHLLASGKNPDRMSMKEDAHRLIKTFFKLHAKCESEEDWKDMER
ncbi:ATP-dependent DNA helicase Q5 isoform X2 [Protopterus annectens]|uniref:ATP-dependent DNA helicase Q5 isoform X2 n=1 Tax=Protopterus annectens TaxID=7888 RepID=UPI001CFC25E1|nr:ATP-dependent DNA helicase Q5 isoform X2 [Protopterus annectens]